MAAVSIGMPVYNGERYLDNALAAVSAQTFADLQIVISDNASMDGTPDIIASWAARDPRIVCHRQPENLGAKRNFEWVLRNSTSDWFMFASYDDGWSPDYIDVLHRAITAQPDTRLAAPQVIQINRDGSENRRLPFFESACNVSGLRKLRLLLKHARSGWYYGLHDRKTLLDAWNRTRNFPYAWGNDFLVLLPILLTGAVTGDNTAIFYQRITNVSDDCIPATLAAQKELFRKFVRESLDILAAAPLTPARRALLYPWIINYADRHAWRIRRLIRGSVKEFFGISQ